ncbi:MAG: alpha/beta fold hydrolase [Acidobacteria bacterium]|nr:alpha/beta fold hydrolase [Acidobacteriota bacterium]
MPPFEPLFQNPHWQTILGSFWRRPGLKEVALEEKLYRTEPAVQILVRSQRPQGRANGELILVHGLEGSSEAGYMRSAAHAALRAGFAVHRMNIRSCGGTEHLCNTLYHAGLTTDIRYFAEHLHGSGLGPVFLAGFSLGANMVTKLAGELGSSGRQLLAGVVSISNPLDLHACALELNERRNWLYQRRFVVHMAARLRRRHAHMPGVFRLDALPGVRTVYEFDDRITAPFFGFGTAPGYYGTQSSQLFLEAIEIPALFLHSKDDPMIPFRVYRHEAFRNKSNLRLLAVEHGGHVGFLARGQQRFWVDSVLVEWLREQARA